MAGRSPMTTSTTPTSTPISDHRHRAEVESLVRATMDRHHIPGLSIAITGPGSLAPRSRVRPRRRRRPPAGHGVHAVPVVLADQDRDRHRGAAPVRPGCARSRSAGRGLRARVPQRCGRLADRPPTPQPHGRGGQPDPRALGASGRSTGARRRASSWKRCCDDTARRSTQWAVRPGTPTSATSSWPR